MTQFFHASTDLTKATCRAYVWTRGPLRRIRRLLKRVTGANARFVASVPDHIRAVSLRPRHVRLSSETQHKSRKPEFLSGLLNNPTFLRRPAISLGAGTADVFWPPRLE